VSKDVPDELLVKYKIPREPILFRGDSSCSKRDVAKRFVKEFVDLVLKVENLYKTNIVMTLTADRKSNHKSIIDSRR